jgi:MFS family permease
MGVRRDLLSRFLLLYAALYASFGLLSPFLPAFLSARDVGPEWLGLLLGAGTAVRLVSAPLAGRLADVFGAFRLELALFAISAAGASLLYLLAHAFWALALANLIQAAMLAPLVPLSDALALSWSRSTMRSGPRAFEYGWVRGGLCSLHCWRARGRPNRRRVGTAFDSWLDGGQSPLGGAISAICARPRSAREFTHSEKKR